MLASHVVFFAARVTGMPISSKKFWSTSLFSTCMLRQLYASKRSTTSLAPAASNLSVGIYRCGRKPRGVGSMCIIDTSLSKLRRPRKSLIEMHHLNVAERRPRMLIQLQKFLGALGILEASFSSCVGPKCKDQLGWFLTAQLLTTRPRRKQPIKVAFSRSK